MTNFLQLIVALVFLTLVSSSVEMTQSPGRAIFWNPSMSKEVHTPDYRTVSMEIPAVDQMLDDHAQKHEIVAVFRSPDGRPIFSHSAIKESIQQAESPIVLPNIYHTSMSAAMPKEGLSSPFSGSQIMSDAQKMNLESFHNLLAAKQLHGPMFNGQVDSYEITMTGDVSETNHMQAISTLANEMGSSCSMLFAAIDTPASLTLAPTTDAQYSRILATSKGSSALLDGLYYKPEGTEYSIYYASTYLYITPDIFTGLMTGIFCFFTLLTGYSCMGYIQGNSSFPTKMPIVGKEA